MTITKEFCDNCGKELVGRDSWLPVKIIFYGRRGLDLCIDKDYKLCHACYSNIKMNIKPEVDKVLAEKDREIERIKKYNEDVVNNLNKRIETIKKEKADAIKYNEAKVEEATQIIRRHCSDCCHFENFLTGVPGNSENHNYCKKLKTDIPENPYIFSCNAFINTKTEYEIYSDGSIKEIK